MFAADRALNFRQAVRLIALAAVLLASPMAMAHPLSQGAIDVVVNADRITVRARVTTEEVQVTNSHTGDNPLPGPWAATDREAFDKHAAYLAAHLHFTADGKTLVGRVLDVRPPEDLSNLSVSSAVYELEYPLPISSPRLVELTHDVLADARFPAGASWETAYNVNISQAGNAPCIALLTRNETVRLVCTWAGGQQAGPAGDDSAQSGKWPLFKTYCIHGIDHIMGTPAPGTWFPREDVGFDHLLFVTALVLSTKSLWDLIKVVTAFTLAHTITLSLAALKLVHVPESVSEPLIALSIVFIAVQNVFWPDQSRGWARLGAAFFFGLFHGLGFAGGLLETMKEMHGATIAVAILAFSLGVELAHQMVVLPLFGTLQLARRTLASEPGREGLSFNIQRFGSVAVSLGGLFYLVIALRESFSPMTAAGIVGALFLFVGAPLVLLRVLIKKRAVVLESGQGFPVRLLDPNGQPDAMPNAPECAPGPLSERTP